MTTCDFSQVVDCIIKVENLTFCLSMLWQFSLNFVVILVYTNIRRICILCITYGLYRFLQSWKLIHRPGTLVKECVPPCRKWEQRRLRYNLLWARRLLETHRIHRRYPKTLRNRDRWWILEFHQASYRPGGTAICHLVKGNMMSVIDV